MTSEKSLSQGGYKSLAELFKERQKEKRALIVVRCPLLSHAWPHSAPGKFSQPSSFHSYFFTRIFSLLFGKGKNGLFSRPHPLREGGRQIFTLYLSCNTIIEEGGSLAAVLQEVLCTDLCPVLGGFGKSLWVTSTNLGTFAPIYRSQIKTLQYGICFPIPLKQFHL